jgi:hypothetical protein
VCATAWAGLFGVASVGYRPAIGVRRRIRLRPAASGPAGCSLPAESTLLLFYRDPLKDPPEEVHRAAGPLPDLRPPAARVLYVPATVATTVRTAPPCTATYRAVPLSGEQIVTGPDWEHPALAQAVAGFSDADRTFMADPFNSDPFPIEMGDKIDHPRHRVVDTPIQYRVGRAGRGEAVVAAHRGALARDVDAIRRADGGGPAAQALRGGPDDDRADGPQTRRSGGADRRGLDAPLKTQGCGIRSRPAHPSGRARRPFPPALGLSEEDTFDAYQYGVAPMVLSAAVGLMRVDHLDPRRSRADRP